MNEDKKFCNEEKESLAIKEDSMEERVQKVLRSVFTAHEGVFNESFGPNEIFGWDSLNHLNLIMALQEEFCTEFGFEEMLEIKVVGDIHQLLTRKMQASA